MDRIVIVEDDPVILRGLSDNLRAEGYGVLPAEDGDTGYRLIRDEQVTMRTPEPIERLMDCFERHGMMRRVVRLRPLGNLKN